MQLITFFGPSFTRRFPHAVLPPLPPVPLLLYLPSPPLTACILFAFFGVVAFNLAYYAHRNPERRREQHPRLRLDHRHAPPRVRCRTVGVPRRSGRSRWVYKTSCVDLCSSGMRLRMVYETAVDPPPPPLFVFNKTRTLSERKLGRGRASSVCVSFCEQYLYV